MRIAVIGSAGQAGSLIATEARNRVHEVVGFGRTDKPGVDIVKDASELTIEDLAGFDVVIGALGFFTPETLHLHSKTALHLADLLSGTDTRLLIVGGAGSLYLDPQHTTQLKDMPDFPAEFRPLAQAQSDQLDALRRRDDVAWTYVSPAADFRAEGERTGTYLLAGEEFQTGPDGESVISYADYAIAMVDEAENAAHPRQRISVHAQ